MALLDDIIGRLGTLPDTQRAAVVEQAVAATRGMSWLPNEGPQTQAYFSPADEPLYGGQGGGGKSDLLLGLALTAHRRSLIMRRTYSTLAGLTQRISEVAGRKGLRESPPPQYRTDDGRLIEFGAAQHIGDEQDWQGRPHDLLGIDEATQFARIQIKFLTGWVRSAEGDGPAVRCRSVLATNPPLDAAGDWIVGYFRPWLDVTHHNPAKPGELRWFVTDEDGNDEEVDGPDPIERGGKAYIPKSRTFIPAALRDNPYLINTGYQANLDALPEPIRSAVRDGNFMAIRADAPDQIIPTQWVIEAQARWRPDGWRGVPMTCMALDPAGGGRDSAEIARRHGGWYAPMVSAQGEETADGSRTAATIVQHRRNGCPVIVDVGGGYAGGVIVRMGDNGIPFDRFNGAEAAIGKTKGGNLTFANKRALAWWRFREELDPDQEGGSDVALPPDPEVIADLTAPTFTTSARGILVESKDAIRKRLGRSPGKGDAIVMAGEPGQRLARSRVAAPSAMPRLATRRFVA